MKKHLKRLFALAFIPLILSSCKEEQNQNNNSNNTNQTELNNENENNTNNNENGNGEGENTNNGENENNQNQDPPKEEIQVSKLYKFNIWDEKLDEVAKKAVGDMHEKIPKFIATRYETELNTYVTDNESFLIFTVACFGTNPSSAERIYREKMVENGFTMSSQGQYGFLMKDYESDLFLDYAIVTDDVEPYFEIKSYVRNTRELEWNSYLIDLYAGMHVPVCPASAYNHVFNNIQNEFDVLAMFLEDNAMSKYQKILTDAGYTYNSNSTTDCVVYDDPTGYVSVQVYVTAGDYNTEALYITISNSWPTFVIMAFNGIANFPKINCDDAIYGGWSMTDAQDTLLIYFDNVTNVDFANYIDLLVDEYGFVASNQRSGDNSMFVDLTLVTESYDVELTLGFQYNELHNNSICIAFYQCLTEGE